MKKALIITALGGFIRSFLTSDIKILQDMGYEVHCAANINHEGADGLAEYFEEMNVVFHQIDFSSNRPISKETLMAYKQVVKLIKKTRFSLIHCHTPIAGVITRVAARKQQKKGTKVIYTTHGFYFHKHSSKKTWMVFRTIEDLMSRYSDAIITINHEDYSNAKKMHCSNVYYIPGVGVDTKRFSDVIVDRDEYRKKLGVKKEDFLILGVGELSHRKNHQIIIKALGEAKIPNSVFMICGNAMNSANTKDELEKLAKQENVDLRLMGLRKDIPEICKCADIGVMPSTREGLGLSGIEMLASGLPVVASDVHGIVDYIINNEDGYLCNPYDYREFSGAIKKALKTKDVMKKKCKKYAKPFDKKYANEKMKEIYQKILG